MTRPVNGQPRQDDPKVERALREQREALNRLATSPAGSMLVIHGVELADGVTTPVAHKLGRIPVAVLVSAVRGPVTTAGSVEEDRYTPATDRSRYVVLKAVGFGATVTVDVVVL